ncbi:MAG: DUF2330 domain-containing protein [Myxococcales bacterium]|nr:DUF2330 domain-containing protein [Myxococcales bacterium]
MPTHPRASTVTTLALGLGLALAGAAAPRPAQACGATFCDGGPAPMPVEQTGEVILFVIDDGYVEAHIQIEYDPKTRAQQFAWVVPVTALPEFYVGSQPLMANLLAGSVPAHGLGSWSEPCGFDGCDDTGGSDDDEVAKLDLGQGEGPPDAPEVVLATSVGAFDVFVLDGGTVAGVMQWLGDNGFDQDPAAEPILEAYLAEGHLFVAFRLATKADAAQVHPITLRYPGSEPCVPIRLTRIAAQDDMEIRALFLSDNRVASSNYRHVTLNPLKLDWLSSGANYRELVSRAVDEPGADGHAFVTEYAGSSAVVRHEGISDSRWDPDAFAQAMTSAEAAELLLDQALVGYDLQGDGACGARHPLVEGLVAQYLPTPPEVPLSILCDDLGSFVGAVDPTAWDAAGFAADMTERIVEPGARALALLDTWPVLTRLYTTLSPHEMTEDPMFHATPELPEQTARVQVGTRNSFCDGQVSFTLPDGRLVAMESFGSWPDIAPEQMPWAQTVEYLPARGAPVVEVDNRDLIASLLDEWNAVVGPPPARIDSRRLAGRGPSLVISTSIA